MNDKMNHMLTQEEIQTEVEKIRDFFSQIPDALKADAAEHFIAEIVNWASHDLYQALGIFEEAKLTYRMLWMEHSEEEEDVDEET